MSPTPAIETEILIIGAGLAGAATAYHLGSTGRKQILLIDQEATPGVHSSGRNASLIRELADESAIQPLMSEGAELLRRGELARYEATGLLLVGQGEEEVSRWVPNASGRALWCPQDGIVDVAGLLQHYLQKQQVLWNTTLLRWEHTSGKMVAHTNRGEIRCELLVNAAGPWAGELGGLPLTARKRHLFNTPPQPWVNPRWPFVWDEKNGFYFRPESGGLLLSGCDEIIAPPGDYSEEPAVLDMLADKIERLQPWLREVTIQTSWVGQRTFADDRNFVIGFDPRQPQFFHVAGLGGHGVTSSYAVGRMAADLILGRRAEHPDLAPARLLPSMR
ncbi:MAG: FAD-dependent catabolic D-arginine dehydrogenase DauA [Phycisphaerae bacterium]|nr:FAD-dependent catabolic D-arginine dehydrogenase DauA [Phycisphaerae bacterium]